MPIINLAGADEKFFFRTDSFAVGCNINLFALAVCSADNKFFAADKFVNNTISAGNQNLAGVVKDNFLVRGFADKELFQVFGRSGKNAFNPGNARFGFAYAPQKSFGSFVLQNSVSRQVAVAEQYGFGSLGSAACCQKGNHHHRNDDKQILFHDA